MDLPEVVEVADELVKKHPASDRIKTFAGDYHTAKFPSGQDAVLFFGVLHQETPAAIEKLLEKAYGALNPGGTVHVLDMMTDSTHTAPKFSALFAVNMALTTDNGWVFSDAELSDWLTGAGFRDINCEHLPPPMPHWLVSGRKEGES
jgi:cyclopropane fatty-acyl-phospholipid synthase-like methyltransferase